MSIDRFDAKILKLIQTNNRLTSAEIGAAVGLSHTSVVRRMKRLREAEVIVADIASVSAKAVGYPVRVNVLITIERDSPDTLDRFVEAIRSDPEVISADAVMGEADFLLTVVAQSMEAYHQLLRRYQNAFPSLKNVTSLAVLEQIKPGFPVPIDVGDPVNNGDR
jgi:Lrp/AsnC family leucine-responsive transcriptional regulator